MRLPVRETQQREGWDELSTATRFLDLDPIRRPPRPTGLVLLVLEPPASDRCPSPRSFRMTVSAHSKEDPEGRCEILRAKVLDQAPSSAELDLACEHDGMKFRMKEFWYLRTINSRKHLISVLFANNDEPIKNSSFANAPFVFVYQRCE
jgi:hypothetical protein